MHQARAATIAEINVTPLVDVCLVLLIIFMVVTPLVITRVPIELPKAVSAEKTGDGPLQISLKADRTVFVGSNVIRIEELSDELIRQRAVKLRPIVVQADKSLAYGDVVSVLDSCRKAGFDEVGLAAQRPPVD